MSAKKQAASDSSENSAKRQPMPFEPKRKPAEKKAKQPAASTVKSSPKTSKTARSGGIPEVVSQRMLRRIAIFCGVPSVLGMSTFVLSYLIVSKHWFDLPTYAVLLVSLGWFGLGVLGVSYGALSASWDEENTGSRLGIAEFKTNWGRMTEAWRAERKANR